MAGISQVEAARKYGADSCCDLCYHLFQRQGAAGVPGAAKTKPHSLKPQSDSNGLATLNGPTGSSPGSDACGDPSGGGTGTARSTSHGSMKQEAAGHEFHPKRVKEMTMRCRTVSARPSKGRLRASADDAGEALIVYPHMRLLTCICTLLLIRSDPGLLLHLARGPFPANRRPR
jgi:hypothetical protein